MKKLLRFAFALIGAFVGYAVYNLISFFVGLAGHRFLDLFPDSMASAVVIFFAIIFAVIFYAAVPMFQRRSARLADNVQRDLKNVSGGQILAGAIGLILGLLIAALISQLFAVIENSYLRTALTIVVYAGFAFVGISVAITKEPEIAQAMAGLRREPSPTGAAAGRSIRGLRKKPESPKILDTSVIIDGRIADIMKTGFLEGQIVIPDFVLIELQHIADSSDSLKRTRGRRGLDILNMIREKYGVDIYNTEGDRSLKEIPEVDVKLLKLAQNIGGKVVTNDYNLNKVAGINGVSVLNINELANCLKPVVLPGERMTVHLVKKGSNVDQAVAYLDDGTMIVVEDGVSKIGKTVEISVTSAPQTAAGRMIFGRLVRQGGSGRQSGGQSQSRQSGGQSGGQSRQARRQNREE